MKKKSKTNLFFFFDRYSLGGAQRIHIDILQSVKDIPKSIFFTRKSYNTAFRQMFYAVPNSIINEIHFFCDYLIIRPFAVHFYSFYLNRHPTAKVFSSNSTFFYDMLPFLKKSLVKMELFHNFTGKYGMEYFGLLYHKYLDFRFIYDTHTFNNIRDLYLKYNVPAEYLKRTIFIEPGVDIPDSLHKIYTYPVNILYAGRGAWQKRIHLLNQIAEYCILQKWPVKFHFAGTMAAELSELVKSNSTVYGEVNSKDKMNEIYSLSHILIMTSAYEGFPMFIKEGMAYGCVPLVTPLEGNKMHLTDHENSLLINSVTNEEEVIHSGINAIKSLISNISFLEQISRNAYAYARLKFDKAKFMEKYSELLKNYS